MTYNMKQEMANMSMATGILISCVMLSTLTRFTAAQQFCACARVQNGHLELQHCVKCNYEPLEPPDDYRRYSNNMVNAPQNRSLVDAVKNHIKRQSIFSRPRKSMPGGCLDGEQYTFKDERICNLLEALSKSSDGLTTSTQETKTDGITTKTNSPDDSHSDSQEGLKKSDSSGVSAGVVVAVAIIFFISGLVVMFLVMRFCKHHLTNIVFKKSTSLDHIQGSSNENNNRSEMHFADHSHAVARSNTDRTSYEGLRPENRSSNVYNAIDPEYQTTEQPAASAQQTTADYFVLEKENNSVAENGGATSGEVCTDRNYFVLEKNSNDAAMTAKIEKRKSTEPVHSQHEYFALEKQTDS